VLERHAPTLLLRLCRADRLRAPAMAGFACRSAPDEAADALRSTGASRRAAQPSALRAPPARLYVFFLTHTISNTYMNALVGKAGGTASAVGTSLAISAVLELPAMTLVSRLQKRFSPGFFLRFAAGAEVVKFLIFYLARSMPLIYLGHCMQFFQFAVYAPATVYYVAAALPERDQLKGQSLIYVAGSGRCGALGRAAFPYHRESSHVERQKGSSEAAPRTVSGSGAAFESVLGRARTGETTAKNGPLGVKGPGRLALVGVLTGWFHDIEFIAEDLGYPTPEVTQLLADSRLPGHEGAGIRLRLARHEQLSAAQLRGELHLLHRHARQRAPRPLAHGGG